MRTRQLLVLKILLFHVATNFGGLISLQELTLDQKIAQIFIVTVVVDQVEHCKHLLKKGYRADCEYVKDLISKYQIGGIIFLGKSTCNNQFKATIELQKSSLIPLLVAQDLEWGLAMRLTDGMQFPRNQALGMLSPDYDHLIYQIGYEIGRQCQILGVHLNLAPVVDVNSNPNNLVIGTRSLGANPKLVAHKSILFMQGLQVAGIAACAKHFPGHGDTDVDSHDGLPCLQHTRQRLWEIELYPFQQIISAGVKTVMTGHLAVPAFEPQVHLPASLSKNITTDLLKGELGFTGLVVTDALDMAGVMHFGDPGQVAVQAFLAGADLLLCCPDVERAIACIKQAVIAGEISEAEIDQKVAKILELKKWAGCAEWHKLDLKTAYFHTPEADALQCKLSR